MTAQQWEQERHTPLSLHCEHVSSMFFFFYLLSPDLFSDLLRVFNKRLFSSSGDEIFKGPHLHDLFLMTASVSGTVPCTC